MKKTFIVAAIAAAVLATGCAKNEIFQAPSEPTAVEFGVNVPLTKAGHVGEMTTAKLKDYSFGVFAATYAGDYADESRKMDFMYNENIDWNEGSSSWVYEPVKYWPNQIQAGNTDAQPATAFAAHKVSFFAYAPYVADPSSDSSYGITGFTAKDVAGDPKVTYKIKENVSHEVDIDDVVDLLWGVYRDPNPANKDVDGTWTNVAGTTTTLHAGLPYLDLQKPALNTKIHFYFYHALSQIKLTAQAAYDQVAAGGTAKNGVKITISEVKVTVPGMYTQADLNLNNVTMRTPKWENPTGNSNLVFTVSGDDLNTVIKDKGDVTAATQPAGVTGSKTDVITTGKYYTLIPKAGDVDVTVKVTYYVTTDDDKLDKTYSRVENVIQKSVSFPGGFVGNKRYNINMVLGISEVKFDAEVEDWSADGEVSVDLPKNKE